MDTDDKKDETESTQGETPEEKAVVTIAPTLEELQKENEKLARHAKNKEEEAARVQKRVDAFEKADVKRQEAQLSKEQLLEKRTQEAEEQTAKVKADAEANLAKISQEAEGKLLKAAFLLKAKDMGFEHPDDAFMLADRNAIIKKDDGEFDEVSIEAALKPLTGRLPVKTVGDGKGTPKLPQPPKSKISEKIGRAFNRPF